MLPNWLLKDGFLWQELFKFGLSLLGSIFLALLAHFVLAERDKRLQEIERKRQILAELKAQLIRIWNDYYKIRKRYTTIRDTSVGTRKRNPYIANTPEKLNEIFDNLIVDCINLEAEYYPLKERVKVSFRDLWSTKVRLLLSSEGRERQRDNSLQEYFMRIRHRIEDNLDIDDDFKQQGSDTFTSTLRAFEEYESKLGIR